MLFFQRGAENARQVADILGHQEVGAHEGFHRPAGLFGVDIAQMRGQRRLHVEAQPLFGAAHQVMQMHAHVPQKGFGLLEGAVLVLGEDAMLDQVGGVVDVIEILADPVERLQVAQAALAFLDVGLDQVTAFALAGMALIALGELGVDEIAAVAGGDFVPELLAQLVIQAAVAPQIARFQDRRADGDVQLGQAHAFGKAARGMADLQPQVPQHVENEFDDAFAPGGLLEGAHEQKVDVRARRQLAAAIAAGGDDGDALGAGRVLRVIHMLDREVVDHLDDRILQPRQRAGGGEPRKPLGFHLVADLVAPLLEGLLDQAQARLAQGAGVGRLARQGGQGMAQGIGIDHVACGKCLRFFKAHGGADHVMGTPGAPPGKARYGLAFWAGLAGKRRGAVPWVRTTVPQAMRSPELPIGWVR